MRPGHFAPLISKIVQQTSRVVDVGARQAPGLAFSLPSVRLQQLLRVVTEHPHKQALVEQSCCKLKYNG